MQAIYWKHPLTSSTRTSLGNDDWHYFMKVYWDFESDDLVPACLPHQYTVNQAARNLTLAIRVKNDLIINEGKGKADMIDEIAVAKLIVDRFFQGSELATPDDVPMWAAVHFLQHYCAAQSVVSRILHNRERQIVGGRQHITDADLVALKGLLSECARLYTSGIGGHQRKRLECLLCRIR